MKRIPSVQQLMKIYLKGYQPTFRGLEFDGKNVFGDSKACKLKQRQLEAFSNAVSQYYQFNISNNNCIAEELDSDNDTYLFFVKNYLNNGFKLYTD